jgi:hypothetical protein
MARGNVCVPTCSKALLGGRGRLNGLHHRTMRHCFKNRQLPLSLAKHTSAPTPSRSSHIRLVLSGPVAHLDLPDIFRCTFKSSFSPRFPDYSLVSQHKFRDGDEAHGYRCRCLAGKIRDDT